jgi:hypothetical protein
VPDSPLKVETRVRTPLGLTAAVFVVVTCLVWVSVWLIARVVWTPIPMGGADYPAQAPQGGRSRVCRDGFPQETTGR